MVIVSYDYNSLCFIIGKEVPKDYKTHAVLI